MIISKAPVRFIVLSILIWTISVYNAQVHAQSTFEDDKVYATPNSPSEGLTTYQTNLLLVGLEQEARVDPNYYFKIKEKWEAHKDITSTVVDDSNKIVTLVLSSEISHARVLELVYNLNPIAKSVTNK